MTEEKPVRPNLENFAKAVEMATIAKVDHENELGIGQVDKAMLLDNIELSGEENDDKINELVEKVNRLALEKNIPAKEFLDLLVISAKGFQEQADLRLPSAEDMILSGLPEEKTEEN